MITLWEVVIGGVWSAAAITVAGYTWEAYTGEFKGFPFGGDVQTFNPAKPNDVAPRINANSKSVAEKLRPTGDVISQISTLYNQKRNLDPGVNRLIPQALAQFSKLPRIDVLTGVIMYVQGHWPNGTFTHTVGPDPKNPVKIPNTILGIAFGKANQPNTP